MRVARARRGEGVARIVGGEILKPEFAAGRFDTRLIVPPTDPDPLNTVLAPL